MVAPGRIPCIRPGCRRTAPVEKYGEDVEIVCGKCWRMHVPARLKNRHKRLNAELRRLNRKKWPEPDRLRRIDRLHRLNWRAIRRSLIRPERPVGLDAFFEETGL